MPRKKIVIVITGVPGTGKTRLAGLLKNRLKDADVIRATELINSERLFSSRARDGSKIVKMAGLKRALAREIEKSSARVVILEGHVLCDIRIRGAKAVVLREHLGKIKRRLLARGYGKEKVKANLVSEATDYCGLHAEKNYGEVFEMLSGSRTTLPSIVKLAKGGRAKKQDINLLEELRGIIKTDRNFAI
jgi:broad-specificity NMP kinase